VAIICRDTALEEDGGDLKRRARKGAESSPSKTLGDLGELGV
jgi:hypothetical protein